MSDGQVAEFDTPLALLQRKSLFSEMVGKTGTDASHRLYQMAVLANRDREGHREGHVTAEDRSRGHVTADGDRSRDRVTADTVITCSAVVTEV